MKKIFSTLFSSSSVTEIPDQKNRFYVLYQKMLSTRLYITIITTTSIMCVLFFIGASMARGAKTTPEWREMLMLVLGALISVWTRQSDFWFNSQRDEKIIVLAYEETGRKDPTVKKE